MNIEFDPQKAKENFRKHHVNLADAEQALRDPMALTIEDPEGEGEQRFITLGMDTTGKILVVVYTFRGENIRLISARKASKAEMEMYYA
ncbi:MAG: BrnT family toxin [Desulfobulbus sp.]|nr:BrnT family toxin [Desulfobulbus sp.]